MKYADKLKNPKWQKKRLKILERDDFTCVYCKDKETTLNVHHKKYTGEPWEAPDEDLETVCEDCHSSIEDIKSIIDDKKNFNCIKIIKEKFKIYFTLTFVLGDCKIGKGAVIIDSSERNHAYFIKKEHMVEVLNVIENGK